MPNAPYEFPPKPATYRIVSVAAPKNVIEVPLHNQDRVVCSPWKTEPHQQWFVQHSGRGYKIRNVKYGLYLAAPNGTSGAIVGTSPEPTVWHLVRTHSGFVITYGEDGRAVDLHYGLDLPGNVLQLWGWANPDDPKRWFFEHINDDVGGEAADTIEDQIKTLNERLYTQAVLHEAEKLALGQKLAKRDQELAGKDRELQAALQSRFLGTPQMLGMMADLRQKMEELEHLAKVIPGREHEASNNSR